MFNDPDFQTLLQNPDAFFRILDACYRIGTPNNWQTPADVDNNGRVNVQDLTFVATRLGEVGQSPAGCQ